MRHQLVVLFLGFSLSVMGQVKVKDSFPEITIAEVAVTTYDTFRIAAVIREIFVCPPCPKGVICKPCLGDHILVGPVSGPEKASLRIFTKETDRFRKGKAYSFLVQWHNRAHHESGTSLISYVRANHEK